MGGEGSGVRVRCSNSRPLLSVQNVAPLKTLLENLATSCMAMLLTLCVMTVSVWMLLILSMRCT
jgi:hypothetical protein